MQNYASLQETNDQEEQGILFHVAEPTRSKWNHIEDLDTFFTRMYKYHQKHGFVCMLLQEIFELNQFIFVLVLTAYLLHGIDYAVLFNYEQQNNGTKPSLNEVILTFDVMISHFTTITWFLLVIATITWIKKFLTRCYQVINFWDIKQFYNTALNIEDSNLDNLTWHDVQTQIKTVQLEQQMCIHKRELTELDIYHRILRQENYIVAMVNKKLIPPRMNLPFLGEVIYWTKGLRYNIQGLLFWSPWSPFENPWHLREEYKRHNLRQDLARQLGRQILFLALINLIFAPVIFVWQILYTFFSYGELIRREPGKIGVRNWSLYGKLYLRHFNELDHELHARLTRAYLPAAKYLSAFSSPIATVVAQHVGFVCGSLFAVIVVLTLYDEDVIAVEHVITLMTGLGAATAICRGIIPDETLVWCPESLLQGVVMHTHYLPSNWRGQAHTSQIREEFQQLFQYRFVALLEELLSPLITPFLMCRWMYPRSLDIVDFFRNFTVSVVGVGDVCSFAQMDVKKHGNRDWQKEDILSDVEVAQDQYTQGEDGKVELSLVHFTTTNPNWVLPPEAQDFVDSLQEEITPYQEESARMFESFQNLMESEQIEQDYDVQSTVDFKGTGKRSVTQQEVTFSPSFISNTKVASSSSHRKSVWMSEGPDPLGAVNMRSSAIALHDRFFRQRQQHLPPEESTPLLLARSRPY